MEELKRIRVVFRDDDILSETQKLEGLRRSWVLFKPHHHDVVSDLASHLLHAFRLHQSCPHGLLLSLSGYVLPPFESTAILKEDEIISVRKRKEVLSIEGNDAPKEVQKLKALDKQPVNTGAKRLTNEERALLLTNDEPEEESEEEGEGLSLLEVVKKSNQRNRKRKAAEKLHSHALLLTNDEPEEESEEEGEGLSLSEVVKKSNQRNRKRKAAEKLHSHKEKKQRSEATGNTSSDVCKDKKDDSIAGDDVKNRDDSAEHSDDSNMSEPDVKGTDDVQEKDKEIDNAEILPKETKKLASRSARRKYAKRIWLRDMAKIRKQNENCESEGLRNWKEDHAKADRKKLDGQWKGQRNWKNYEDDAERNKEDGQPKGLLHLKPSSQNSWPVRGKKHKQYSEYGDFRKHPNRNGDVHKHQNKNGDKHEQLAQMDDMLEQPRNQNGDKHKQLTQMDDILEQPNDNLHDQPDKISAAVQEHSNQNCDASKQSNHESAKEEEVVPIEVRPGHIRFEPLEEEEQAVQKDHAPLETFNWNGITSKKKGQQWGKESRRFTPRNDYRTNNGDSETLTTEKEKQPNEEIDFDKLPPLPGIPKKGDLIAYRVLELSSTWTPELSAHRVGKVSWYNTESTQTMLLPLPEYPIIFEKDDEDETAQPANSLYKEDGSLEIDFPELIDVRILTNGRSEPGNEAVPCVSEASTGSVNALKTDNPTAEPNPETPEPKQGKESQTLTAEIGTSVWDQLTETLNAKKEQLSKQNGWGSTPPKKVVVVSQEKSWGKNAKKPQASSPGSNWGKNTQKPQASQQENNWDKQCSSGSKSWSYRALRGSALGPTMALLRSKKDT